MVEYEGGVRLNVPLYRLDQLEPYRAAGNGDAPPPRLHRLGSTTWQRQRDKTRAAIRGMATELLDLYARRGLATGFAFLPDTPWQRALESAFLYEDTPDQRRATDEVKRDMERARPMDRLLVGDVGYGKTEVAVRAAFKAVQSGKQVAVLVPTTILAEQHGRTFRERLADYPVRIEVLSRFRSPAETRRVLGQLARGEVDVIIGTHRLLSRDATFHDLGLLIVDEEHRFGVRHKERLKALKLAVDVLTLTATPIPPDAAPLAGRVAGPHAARDGAEGPVAGAHVHRAVGRRAARGGVWRGNSIVVARCISCTTGSKRSRRSRSASPRWRRRARGPPWRTGSSRSRNWTT